MERLYVRDGVEVALITVEVWSRGVIVRLVALPSELTERIEQSYFDAVDEWGRTRREGRPRDDRPPDDPGQRLFDVELTLGDDLGTSYESQARSYGGSLERLRANWAFEPGPPDSVANLTVAVAGDGIEKTSVRVAL
jgi:hypothetical protein